MRVADFPKFLERRFHSLIPDEELLRRFRLTRDESAFRDIVQRHGPLVLQLCRRRLDDAHAAEDAFQATFLTLSRKAGSIRRPEALAAWLYGVAHRISNKARIALERRRRRETRAVKPTQSPEQPSANELLDALDDELHRLPERYRLPLWLCFWQGLTQDQVAKRLGWTPGSVKGRIERGRKLLAARLTKRGLAPAVLLTAALTPAAVPGALLASTSLFAVPGAVIPATVLSLTATAGTAKVLTASAFAVLLAGAGMVGLAGGFASPQAPGGKAAGSPIAPRLPVAENVEPMVDAHGDPLPHGAIARLGTPRLRHGEWVRSIAYAPDGNTIASASSDLTIRIWDCKTGREIRRLLGHKDQVQFVRFISDGKQIVSASGGWHLRNVDTSIRLWDVATGREVRTLVESDTESRKNGFALSDDGKVLAFGVDQVVRLLSVPSGEHLADLPLPNGLQQKSDGLVKRACFSPDGRRVAAVVESLGVCVLDVATRSVVWTNSEQPTDALSSNSGIAFTPDGNTIAVATAVRKPLRLLDVTTGQVIRTFASPPNGCGRFVLSPDGRTLISSGWEKSGLVWDVATGQLTGQLDPGIRDMTALAYSPDGRRLAVAGQRSIQFHDFATGRLMPIVDGANGPINRIALLANGKLALTGSYWDQSSGARIWDLATGNSRLVFAKQATCVALAPGGRLFAAGYSDGVPDIVDVANGAVVRSCKGSDRFLDSITFSRDGAMLIGTGWFGQTIHTWDVATGEELPPIGQFVKGSGALCLALSPDGRLLATGGLDRVVRLWDIADRKQVRELTGYGGAVAALAWSPDGARIAVTSRAGTFNFSAGDHDRAVQIWDAANGAVSARLDGPAAGSWSVAWSPDGRSIAAGGEDRVIRIWELASGKERLSLKGHEGPVGALAFSVDGRQLISGSSDTTALVWDPWRFTFKEGNHDRLWAVLANDEPAVAFGHMAELAQSTNAVSFIGSKLTAVETLDAALLAALIDNLDSDQFAVRDRATTDLSRLGERATAALRAAGGKPKSAEMKKRAGELLDKLEAMPLSPETLRSIRAIEVLERIGSIDARRVIENVASGDPASRITIDAKASLERFKAKQSAAAR